MKDFIDFENNYRFFKEEKQLNLLYAVAAKIKEQILSNEEIVELIRKIDAEISHDILKILMMQKYISNDDYNEIDSNLIKIYEKEFVQDLKNGTIEDRIKFKTDKNKRLISRYEILGIYFSKTLDSMPLFGMVECEDEVINNLAIINKKLCTPKLANLLTKKQSELFEKTLYFLIDEIKTQEKTND